MQRIRFVPMFAVIAALALPACTELGRLEADQDARQQAADLSRCRGQGFVTGTSAMATCLASVAATRESERDRQDRQLAADDAYARQRDAERSVAGVPPSDRPTALGAGVDPETANMSLCSDGALREDCADAPLGY